MKYFLKCTDNRLNDEHEITLAEFSPEGLAHFNQQEYFDEDFPFNDGGTSLIELWREVYRTVSRTGYTEETIKFLCEDDTLFVISGGGYDDAQGNYHLNAGSVYVYSDNTEQAGHQIFALFGEMFDLWLILHPYTTSGQTYITDFRALCWGYYLDENYTASDIHQQADYGDTSTAGGGLGNFDNTSDEVDFGALPTGSAEACGMVRMYNPTSAELSSLATYLWTGTFVDNIKKLWQDPMEAIISLMALPVTPATTTSTQITVGGVGTGVNAKPITSQFVRFDFGSLNVKEYWGQALDYSPYTKAQIYLPYVGMQPISIDDIMGSTLNLVYNIDILTGSFTAMLKVTKTVNGTPLKSVIYDWSGNMGMQLPIAARDFTAVFNTALTVVSAVGLTAVSGGAGAAPAAAGASALKTGAVASAVASSASAVMNTKQHVQRGGRLDGSIGAMSINYPYIILERPIQSLSSNYKTENGYPSNVTRQLSTCNGSGMTVCEAPILNGISCTDTEREQIREILTSGVIL